MTSASMNNRISPLAFEAPQFLALETPRSLKRKVLSAIGLASLRVLSCPESIMMISLLIPLGVAADLALARWMSVSMMYGSSLYVGMTIEMSKS